MAGTDGNKWKSGSCISSKTKANRNIPHKSRKGGQIAITYVDDKKSKKILVAVTVPFRFQCPLFFFFCTFVI